jgi:hypothetical protein
LQNGGGGPVPAALCTKSEGRRTKSRAKCKEITLLVRNGTVKNGHFLRIIRSTISLTRFFSLSGRLSKASNLLKSSRSWILSLAGCPFDSKARESRDGAQKKFWNIIDGFWNICYFISPFIQVKYHQIV